MSEKFIAGAPVNKIVIVGGGFKMQSSVPVSFFASCCKTTAWKTFVQHDMLLENLARKWRPEALPLRVMQRDG